MSALPAFLAEIRACRICREQPTGATPLPHEPRPVFRLAGAPPILICGQAPGTRVHASGIPFTDPSGVRLREWLGLDEKEFYDVDRVGVVPMGFCFPGLDAKGGDLPPRKECAATWHNRLFALLPPPDVLVLVGQYALAYHARRLGLEAALGPTLTETVVNWPIFADRQQPRVFPLPHPSWRNNAWIKKNPWFAAELLPALRAAVARHKVQK